MQKQRAPPQGYEYVIIQWRIGDDAAGDTVPGQPVWPREGERAGSFGAFSSE